MTTFVDRELRLHAARPTARPHIVLEDDDEGWRLETTEAREAARLRHAFRDYLEAYGHPASDFSAAEVIYGELTANCVEHAPGHVRVEFCWHDSTLSVIDDVDRLRSWPYSPAHDCDDVTQHGYAIVSALSARVQLAHDAGGGTRASVVLPVLRALD
jgi:hypothetical protein